MKLIKVEQPNCNPCKMVSNFLNSQNVTYEVVDATEQPEVASQYGIMSVPVTILLDDNGNEVARSNGFKPDELENLISQL